MSVASGDGRAGVSRGGAAVQDHRPEARSDGSSEAAPAPGSRRGRFPGAIVGMLLLLAAAGGVAWYAGLIDVRRWEEVLPWHAERTPGSLTLYGNVDVRQVNLAFKVDGRIVELAVDEGDAVGRGQVLATLDRRYFDDELRLAGARRDAQAATLARLEHGSRPEEIAQARAQVAERKAGAGRAQLDFRRAQALLGRQAISQQEFDQILAALREAEAQLESAEEALQLSEIGPRAEDIDAARAQLEAEEAAVSQAGRRLEDSRLVAPGDGVILTRAREAGAIVQPGETVFTLTLSSPVWVRTYVPEPDLGRARPGTSVEVTTDSAPDRPYRGRVGYISPTAEFTPKSVETPELRTRLVYRVRIVVDDPDGGLRQGMPVTVRVPLPRGGPG